ncbi:MAG: P-type conjugative transfer protein TrbJ [Tatlockia sp.]|nr:P-type conjugative transfer protein TrbJ [Tatlockia sp.]
MHFTKRVCKLALTLITTVTSYSLAWAMIVHDPANYAKNVAIALKQIKQYDKQVEQFKLMQKNSQPLDQFHWNEATITMDNLLRATDSLNYYKQQAGSMDAYLSRYQNQTHYQNSPCFNGSPCSTAQLNALMQKKANASEAQKRANDAMLRGIEQQQNALQSDARQLKTLQGQAQDAQGQMAALQAASQLASAEANQLLQIRALLVTQQTAYATRLAALADKEAIQAAGDEQFRSGTFKKSSGRTW